MTEPKSVKTQSAKVTGPQTAITDTRTPLYEVKRIDEPVLGEYTLHLYLAETCKISYTSDLNAMMEIEGLGQKKRTRIWSGIGPSSRTRWDEHFFLRHTFKSREELEQASISITLYDRRKMLSNVRIGTVHKYVFNMVQKISDPVLNKWAVFTDPENNFGNPCGFLRFSMTFTPSTSEQVDLEAMSNMSESLSKEVDLPATIVPSYHELAINVYRARNILGIESSGKSDPMLEVELGGIVKATDHKAQESNPTFYQTIRLRYAEPTMDDRVNIRLYDWNRIEKNVKLGTLSLNLEDIKSGFYAAPKWLQFYGASSHSKDEEVKKMMITQPDYASTFVGDVFLSATSSENPKAALAVESMNRKEIETEKLGWQQVIFTLQVEVEYVYNLDVGASAETLEAVIEWGSNTRQNRIAPSSYKNKLLILNKGVTLRRAFDVNFSSTDEARMNKEVYKQIPDVFVYLSLGGKNIAFYRFDPLQVMVNVKGFDVNKTVKLKPDMAVSQLSIDEAGLMKLKIAMREEPRPQSFLNFFRALQANKGNRQATIQQIGDAGVNREMSDPLPEQVNDQIFPRSDGKMKYQQVYIFVQLYQAKELVNVEADGLPDCFVDLYHFGSNVQSKIIRNSLNPCWSELLVLPSYRVNDQMPNLVVNVYDQNETTFSGARNELIGWQEIKLTMQDYAENESQIEYNDPRWHSLKVVGDVQAGQVLLSVRWCMHSTIKNRQDLVQSKSQNLRFTASNYHGRLTVSALRDLKPKSMFMPNNTSIRIDTSSVWRSPGDESITNITLKSDGVGVNPMYRRTEYFFGALPEEMYLIPSMPGEVLDEAFSMFPGNQKIGDFVMDLSFFAYLSKVQLAARLQVLKDHREQMLKAEPDNDSHRQTLYQISGVINHLLVAVDKQSAYLEKKMPDAFVQVNVLREDAKEMTEQRLMIASIDVLGNAFAQQFQQAQGLNQPQPATGGKDDATRVIVIEQPKERLLMNSGTPNINETMQNSGLALQGQQGPIKDRALANLEKKEIVIKRAMMVQAIPNRQLPAIPNVDQKGPGGANYQINESIPLQTTASVSPYKDQVFGGGLFELFRKQEAQVKRIAMTPAQYAELKPEERKDYVQLGYQSSKVNTIHYRLKVLDNLEDTSYLGVDPFSSINIYRGRTFIKQGRGFFNYLDSKFSEHRIQTGIVRAKLELIQEEVFDTLASIPLTDIERRAIEIPRDINTWRSHVYTRHEVTKHDVILFVYIIEATFSVGMDRFSNSNDAYIKVVAGEETRKGKRVVHGSNQPHFMERFEIPMQLRDSSMLEIQFWDKDVTFDDEIGSTKIELLRRFYDRRMRSRDDNPIEVRNLADSDGNSVGYVSMWIDFMERQADGSFVGLNGLPKTPWDIEPRPPTKLYLRGVVWDILNMPIPDVSGAADYVVVITVPALGLQQKTDVHLRATDGDGSFNWRFEFPIDIDYDFHYEGAKVNFRVFDKEVFVFDKFLADLEINFSELVQSCLLTDQDQKMLGPRIDAEDKQSERFMKVMTLSRGLIANEKSRRSKIELSMEVLTQTGRDNKPAGLGRSAPNDNPYLPPPEGRMQWSWNPVKMFQQMFGKNCKRYCCLIIILIIVILLLGYFAPILVSMIITRAILPSKTR